MNLFLLDFSFVCIINAHRAPLLYILYYVIHYAILYFSANFGHSNHDKPWHSLLVLLLTVILFIIFFYF